MADIVNLRQARKRKKRDESARIADENRRAHGRTAAERTETRLSKSLADKRLDAHRRKSLGDSESS